MYEYEILLSIMFAIIGSLFSLVLSIKHETDKQARDVEMLIKQMIKDDQYFVESFIKISKDLRNRIIELEERQKYDWKNRRY